MATVRLELSMKQYEALHALADGRGKETRIAKSQLRKLLVDLTRLYHCAVQHHVDLEETP